MNKKNTTEKQACTPNGCLYFTTVKLTRVLNKIADDAFSKTGLSPSHALLLYLVNEQGGMMQKDLGETLHLTPSTITRLIEKLERKKLVSKCSEGKHVYLTPTGDGLALQGTILDAWNLLHGEYQGILTDEETAQYLILSTKLLEKLEKN